MGFVEKQYFFTFAKIKTQAENQNAEDGTLLNFIKNK